MRYLSVCSGIEAAKTCASCGVEKSVDQFYRQGARGRHVYCKECYNSRYRGKRRRPVDAETRRAQNIKTRYGLTPGDVAALLNAQGGKCAICAKPPARPVVDHDHGTGRVRGILCHGRNIKLPAVEDEAFVVAASAYLRRGK